MKTSLIAGSSILAMISFPAIPSITIQELPSSMETGNQPVCFNDSGTLLPCYDPNPVPPPDDPDISIFEVSVLSTSKDVNYGCASANEIIQIRGANFPIDYDPIVRLGNYDPLELCGPVSSEIIQVYCPEEEGLTRYCPDGNYRLTVISEASSDSFDMAIVAELTARLANFDSDGDGFSPNDGDCDDLDDSVFPGATEIPGDSIDNNCNGEVDEGTVSQWYPDCDGDGSFSSVGTTEQSSFQCSSGGAPAGGWSDTIGDDCDDEDDTRYPGALELKDGIDNDCDGDIDEGTSFGSRIFTTSDTFFVPYDIVSLTVEVVGGGGGGGGGGGISTSLCLEGQGGGGGGAGGLSQYIVPVEPGREYSVTVGPGGNSGDGGDLGNGASGTFGGNSSFGSSYWAGGGEGGEGGAVCGGPLAGNGGAGGEGNVADGSPGSPGTTCTGGTGGTGEADGGSGGNGGCSTSSPSGAPGTSGQPGRVSVSW